MSKFSKLPELLRAKTTSLRELAEIVDADPDRFYRGADFSGLDLRCVDISGYDLTGASFFGAIFDSSTAIDGSACDDLHTHGVNLDEFSIIEKGMADLGRNIKILRTIVDELDLFESCASSELSEIFAAIDSEYILATVRDKMKNRVRRLNKEFITALDYLKYVGNLVQNQLSLESRKKFCEMLGENFDVLLCTFREILREISEMFDSYSLLSEELSSETRLALMERVGEYVTIRISGMGEDRAEIELELEFEAIVDLFRVVRKVDIAMRSIYDRVCAIIYNMSL